MVPMFLAEPAKTRPESQSGGFGAAIRAKALLEPRGRSTEAFVDGVIDTLKGPEEYERRGEAATFLAGLLLAPPETESNKRACSLGETRSIRWRDVIDIARFVQGRQEEAPGPEGNSTEDTSIWLIPHGTKMLLAELMAEGTFAERENLTLSRQDKKERAERRDIEVVAARKTLGCAGVEDPRCTGVPGIAPRVFPAQVRTPVIAEFTYHR